MIDERGHVTATILLIRHAAHAHLGHTLSGRTPDIALSDKGRSQAVALADHFATSTLDGVHTSPVQRARETADALCVRQGLAPQVVAALDELEFGDWSGRAFVDLEEDSRWATWNRERSTAVPPGGESMVAAQSRAWDHVEQTALAAPGSTIAMVSHCDIIRAIVSRVLGLTLDRYDRFDIDPASCTRLAVGAWGAKVLSMNETYS
jgi:broad specificity phosphatase PhoE